MQFIIVIDSTRNSIVRELVIIPNGWSYDMAKQEIDAIYHNPILDEDYDDFDPKAKLQERGFIFVDEFQSLDIGV